MPQAKLSPLFTWRGAIADADLPGPTKCTAYALSLHMSERGDSCFPSVGTMARESGFSERTVRQALRDLESDGWLNRQDRPGQTSLYQAQIPPYTPAAPAPHPGRTCPPPRQDVPGGAAPPAPEVVSEGVKEGVKESGTDLMHRDDASQALPSSPGVQEPHSHGTQPKHSDSDPMLFQDLETNSQTTPPARGLEDGFETFWKLYHCNCQCGLKTCTQPNRGKGSKQKALAAWRARRREGIAAEVLIGAAEQLMRYTYCKMWNDDRESHESWKWVPWPENFLSPSKRHWEQVRVIPPSWLDPDAPAFSGVTAG